MPTGFIPTHGGYKNLLSYQKAEIVYDATIHFCQRFVEKRDRTYDQMVQAARSGKQNIIEGSMASGTSKEMEIKLTNVARASLEELLADYRDFLRVRGIAEWPKEHPYAHRLRELNRIPGATYETFRKGIEHPDPAIRANVIIGLIRVTSLLLSRQIQALEKTFVEEGGLRERMTKARLDERDRQRGEGAVSVEDCKDFKDDKDSKDNKDRLARLSVQSLKFLKTTKTSRTTKTVKSSGPCSPWSL